MLYKKKDDRYSLKNYKSLTMMNINYKIFIEILMRRLFKTLNVILNAHQSVFLFKKLINNNIRTI